MTTKAGRSPRSIENLESWEFIGTVGVDTGRVIVADPCYAPEATTRYYSERDADVLEVEQISSEYGVGLALVCESGLGDGLYNVFVRRDSEHNVTHLLVDFTLPK